MKDIILCLSVKGVERGAYLFEHKNRPFVLFSVSVTDLLITKLTKVCQGSEERGRIHLRHKTLGGLDFLGLFLYGQIGDNRKLKNRQVNKRQMNRSQEAGADC